MEKYDLGDEVFRIVNVYLEETGKRVLRGTMDDATIINAPSLARNQDKQRDPEMRGTRNGKPWYFGMKAPKKGRQQDQENPLYRGNGRQCA